MPGTFVRCQRGTTFIETLVALVVVGVLAAAFSSGLATGLKATIVADEQATAESLAKSQMEWVKNADYVYGAAEYTPAPIPGGKDYINYSALVTAQPLHDPEGGIQKITVTVKHSGEEVIELVGYKVDR